MSWLNFGGRFNAGLSPTTASYFRQSRSGDSTGESNEQPPLPAKAQRTTGPPVPPYEDAEDSAAGYREDPYGGMSTSRSGPPSISTEDAPFDARKGHHRKRRESCASLNNTTNPSCNGTSNDSVASRGGGEAVAVVLPPKKKPRVRMKEKCCCNWPRCREFRASFIKYSPSDQRAQRCYAFLVDSGVLEKDELYREGLLACMGRTEEDYQGWKREGRRTVYVARLHFDVRQIMHFSESHLNRLKPLPASEMQHFTAGPLDDLPTTIDTETGETLYHHMPNVPLETVEGTVLSIQPPGQAQLALQTHFTGLTFAEYEQERETWRRRLDEQAATHATQLAVKDDQISELRLAYEEAQQEENRLRRELKKLQKRADRMDYHQHHHHAAAGAGIETDDDDDKKTDGGDGRANWTVVELPKDSYLKTTFPAPAAAGQAGVRTEPAEQLQDNNTHDETPEVDLADEEGAIAVAEHLATMSHADESTVIAIEEI